MRASVVVLAALAVTTAFFSTLLFGGSLAGADWASHHFHYFDFARQSLTEHHVLPLYMANAWITPNFLANAEAPQLGPLVPLLFVLSTGVYLKLLIAVFGAAGLVGMFALLRDLRVAAEVAVLGSVVFACNGFFTSHLAVGHPWAMGAWLLPALVCLFRRAVRGSTRALVAAAALNAFTIFGGQHQPFIWQHFAIALIAVGWAVQERSWRPVLVWAAFAALCAGLGAVKLFPMLVEFADYDPSARTPGIPLSALVFTLLGRGQDAGTSVSQLAFQHGSGWWEWAFYTGPVALLFLLVGSIAARRAWPLVALGVFFLVLSVDATGLVHGLDPWAALEGLPVWRTQRSPSRFLVLAIFAFSVTGALGTQRLLEAARSRWPAAAPRAVMVLAVLALLDAGLESRAWQAQAVGEPLAAVDSRPRPLRVRAPGIEAELASFAPNTLIYRVHARGAGTLELPLRQRGDEWTIDGWPAYSRGGRLAVDVTQGRHELVLTYRPRFAFAGAATSTCAWIAVAFLGLAGWGGRGPLAA
ncbi:MAG: hypothetical protein HRU01_24095 [Myxococcales bacterium]|nr:hypothetical protein [Myxococcales bacterium]